jgi:HD-GYP domain-containing protein (c-di-GMP phosphodiesterase class II)
MEINGQAGCKFKISLKSIITILCLLFFVGAFAQATDEAKLVATVKEFHQALVAKNTVSLNQQTDKALSYGHSNGWVQSKKDLIKDFETGYISYQSIKEDSITVTINENLANVRFIATIDATMKNTANTFHLKVLEVWVKKGSRWVLFARQAVKG